MSDDAAIPDGETADVTAAELALGLLDGQDRAAALRRMLADRAFAAEVEQWRMHFAQLFDAVPSVAAPPGLADRIETSLSPARTMRGWVWPSIAAFATIAATVLLVVTVTRPAQVVAPPPSPGIAAPAPMLAAVIQPAAGGGTATAIYEPARGVLRIAGRMGHTAGHDEQLWVIAGNAPPRSLGLLAAHPQQLLVTMPLRHILSNGVTLAISVEPVGGSPTGLPTGPVIASGTLLIV